MSKQSSVNAHHPDEDIAIKVSNVSKAFKLPHEKHSSVKGLFLSLFNGKRTYEKQQVLKDISFEIKKGEFFGIVGRNGSGKSTLLKLLAGIYETDSGHIRVNGKLTPFIELGVGFNPELTGRENVFLNGALLGFSRKDMESMYDEIVEFAELEKFMDQKLKNYSSGMQVRLAFSIAIRAESDILVLDEVLAVGDEAFQRKCLDVFENYKSSNKTVILVTHDMNTVVKYCTKAILLSNGEITSRGDTNKVTAEYTKLNLQETNREISKHNEGAMAGSVSVETIDDKGTNTVSYRSGDYMCVRLSWPKDIPVRHVGVSITKKSGEYIFGTNTMADRYEFDDDHIHYRVKLDLDPGKYHLSIGLSGENPRDVLEYISSGPEFMVTQNITDKAGGLVRLDHEWDSKSSNYS